METNEITIELKTASMKRSILFLLIFTLHIAYVHGEHYLIISKTDMKIYVIDIITNDTVFCAPIACGVNFGDKKKRGDHRTPEGTFSIISIERSTNWTHDFKDGFGPRRGAYGNWFFRLKTQRWTSIGIHGTCFPESIGSRCSEGCIRLKNEDIEKIKNYIYVGMICIIGKDKIDTK